MESSPGWTFKARRGLKSHPRFFFHNEAEAAFSSLVVAYGLVEMPPCEVRPEHVGYVYLRIGELPEEEVAYPLLPARPYEKVRVRGAGGVKEIREHVFRYFVGSQGPLGHPSRHPPCRLGYLLAAAVA